MSKYRETHPITPVPKSKFTFVISQPQPPEFGVAVVLPPVPEETAAPPSIQRSPDQTLLEPDTCDDTTPFESGDLFGINDALAELKRPSQSVTRDLGPEIPAPTPVELTQMRCYAVFEGSKAQ